MTNYDIESVATLDARGQLVLPKAAREALGLAAGSKLAVVVQRHNGAPCCITLVPTSELEGRIKEVVDADHGREESR